MAGAQRQQQQQQQQDEFTQFLACLLSPDTPTRRAAEERLETMKQTEPDTVVVALGQTLLCRSGADGTAGAAGEVPQYLRSLCAVMLRQMVVYEEEPVVMRLSVETQTNMQAVLMQVLQSEADRKVRKLVCDTAGEWARWMLSGDVQASVGTAQWPEFVPFLLDAMAQAGNPQLQESALHIFAVISDDVVPEMPPETLAAVCGMLEACLQGDALQGRVRLGALRALGAMVLATRQVSERDGYRGLLNVALESVGDSVNKGFAAVLKDSLELFVELAEFDATFFKFHLLAFTDAMVAMAGMEALPANIRHLSLEFLVMLAEKDDTSVRKLRGAQGEECYFVSQVFPICFNLMLTIPEEPTWETATTVPATPDNILDCDVAEQAFDRIARALGPTASLATAHDFVTKCFEGPEWRHAYTGLLATSCIVETMKTADDPMAMAADVLNSSLPYLEHPHARVRAAVMMVISQLCLHLGPVFQRDHQATVLPVVLAHLNSATNPVVRVRWYASLSLVHFADYAPADVIQDNAHPIMEQLMQSLQEGPLIIQEQVVTAISSIAELCEGQFNQYYDVVMPTLREIFATCTSQELRALGSKALECVSLVGQAVGKERFMPDAQQVMNQLVEATQAGFFGEDDPQRLPMLKAWVRIGKCLGQEFVPYLSIVLPPLLAALKVDVTFSAEEEQKYMMGAADDEDEDEEGGGGGMYGYADDDGYENGDEEGAFHTGGHGDDGDDDDDGEDGDGVQFVQVNGTGWRAVRSSAVQEQEMACQMIMLLAEGLQEHFLPHVEECITGLAPIVTDAFHDETRTFAIGAISELVRCGAKGLGGAHPQGGHAGDIVQLLELALPPLLKAIEKTSVLTIVLVGLQAVRRSIDFACAPWDTLQDRGMRGPPPPTPTTCYQVLTQEQMGVICDTIMTQVGESIQRRAVRRAEFAVMEQEGGVDQEDMLHDAQQTAEELEMHWNLEDCMAGMIKTHGAAFLPVYREKVHELVMEMAAPDRVPSDIVFALYVIDDLIEFMQPDIGPFVAEFLPHLLASMNHEHTGAQQAATYGVSLVAEHCPNLLTPQLEGVVNALMTTIGSLTAESTRDEQESVDNAVMTLGMVCQSLTETLGEHADSLWASWLDHLPLRSAGQEVESMKCTRQLAQHLAQGTVPVLGANGERILMAVEHMLAPFDEARLLSDDVHNDVSRCVQCLMNDTSPASETLKAQWQSVPAELQQVLARVAEQGTRDWAAEFQQQRKATEAQERAAAAASGSGGAVAGEGSTSTMTLPTGESYEVIDLYAPQGLVAGPGV